MAVSAALVDGDGEAFGSRQLHAADFADPFDGDSRGFLREHTKHRYRARVEELWIGYDTSACIRENPR